MIKGLYVPVETVWIKKLYKNIEAIKSDFKISGIIQTMEMQGLKNIGVIAERQDNYKLIMNRLGVMGDFFVIGISEDSNIRSLTNDEFSIVRNILTLDKINEIY